MTRSMLMEPKTVIIARGSRGSGERLRRAQALGVDIDDQRRQQDEAAEYSGVNVRAIVAAVMIISAVCSGLAGMLGVAHFGSAQQDEFDTYLLDSISAVVVGGTSLFGGQGGIPNTIIGLFVLGYTRFGRYVYMVGGNREAAEYSGVNVRTIIAAVMVISAVCSGVAGMLGVAYFGSAQQEEFDNYLLDSISAVVVGGTSLFGGQGGIPNTIIGLFVLGVLNNGLDHINIDSFLKILIRGLILFAALIINVYAQRLRAARPLA